MQGVTSYARMMRRAGWLAVTLGIVTAIVSVAATGDRPAAAKTSTCNGYAALCGRRYDQVAFAGTHNSMNTAADHFVVPEQERSISQQLDGGIRAFLIDVYTGTPTTGHVCTDPTPLKVDQIRNEQGQAALDQLLAIRNAQCPPAGGPTASLYLCHGFCELGATRFSRALATYRTFLRSHPNDVVTLILEDYSPAADIARAFRDAGLASEMVKHEPGKPWPTLAQMKQRGTRLVVFLQNQGGAAPGLLDAFREMGETPYEFHTAAELSCAPNRGPAQSLHLFLLNHWIDADNKRAAAAAVNKYDVLDARAKQCEAQRGHIPNFVAVDFAEVGDLLRVVDDLNGVSAAR